MSAVIDLRNLSADVDLRYECHGYFRGKAMWSCLDANTYDCDESPLGMGESKEDALADLLEKLS